MPPNDPEWQDLKTIRPRRYTCGHCGNIVGPNTGYSALRQNAHIYICSYCFAPTYFENQGQYSEEQIPGASYGRAIKGLKDHVKTAYDEARECMKAGAYTAAAMLCRKILMNVAVSKDAKPNQSFAEYVKWLQDNHYFPPGGLVWIDQIRGKGNEANHEIQPVVRSDAELVFTFTENFLLFAFELPSLLPTAAAVPKAVVVHKAAT